MPRGRRADQAGRQAGAAGHEVAAPQGERQSIYFPKEMAEEIKAEALRQDRSISWIIQKSWRISRPKIQQLPGANEMEGELAPGKKK